MTIFDYYSPHDFNNRLNEAKNYVQNHNRQYD